MFRTKKKLPLVCVALAAIARTVIIPLPLYADDTCTPTTTFLGDYPDDDDDPDWTDNTQGVAHDKGNWFFTTNNEQDTPDGKYLLKFPADFDLATTIDVDAPPAGVQVVTDAMPQVLKDLEYEHFGDLDQAGGFLFVPIDESDPNNAVIGVFRASDLSFVGYKLTEQSGAAWVAYNRTEGRLYSASSHVDADVGLYRYSVDLDMLAATGNVDASIKFVDMFPLLETDGSELTQKFDSSQGGVFTPWGDLYLVNGSGNTDPDDEPWLERGGVHVFSPSGRLSSNSENGSGAFNYEYHPTFLDNEEPQGADWWIRSGSSSPGIGGQLHVIMLDNDGPSEDDLYFKHYDVAYSCLPPDADTDGDGLTDLLEVYTLETDPVDPDSDKDGLPDGMEVNDLGMNPLIKDSDADGVPDGAEDNDGDRLWNVGEVIYGTDPLTADTDGDGLWDSQEVTIHTNPLNPDTDGDGLTDGDEVNVYHTEPLVFNTDGDGLTDGDEVNVYHTNPLVADTDGDRLTDGGEVNVYGTNPIDADTDDDLLSDGFEVTYGTNPVAADTDGDGLIDGTDVEFVQNTILAFPASAFNPHGPAKQTAIKKMLDLVESLLLAGEVNQAVDKLHELRTHLDGCGIGPDANDWIQTCTYQRTARRLVDVLTANLGA